MLARSLELALRLQVLAAHAPWDADRVAQRGGVETPHALEQKYAKVGYTWVWFWLFPSPTLSIDQRTSDFRIDVGTPVGGRSVHLTRCQFDGHCATPTNLETVRGRA
jgi:hypothetical protein